MPGNWAQIATLSRTTADRAKHVGLRLLTVANFGRIVAHARELAVELWDEARKRIPKAAGRVAEGAVVGGAGLAFARWAGHDGLALLLATAVAIPDINGAVGKAGGAFDRLLKTIERVEAKEPAAETRDPRSPEVKDKPPEEASAKEMCGEIRAGEGKAEWARAGEGKV